MKLLCKANQNDFSNIDIKSITDIKTFWKTIKPYFSNKGSNSKKILLPEKERLIKDPAAIATANYHQTIGLKEFQFDHANNLFEDHINII